MYCQLDHSKMSGKFCKSCGENLSVLLRSCVQGHALAPNSRFCAQCGSPASNVSSPNKPIPFQQAPITTSNLPPVTINNTFTSPMNPFPVVQRTNGLAIASLAISLACCGPIGMILGFIAIGQINSDPSQKGKGLATAGIIVGGIGLLGAIIYFVSASGSGY